MSREDWVPGPDFRKGFLRIPLLVWLQVYCRAPLTRRQLQIVSVVIRESWGWATRRGYVQLWTRPLTTRHFANLTGLTTDHLRRDLDLLVRRRILLQDGPRYRFVSDPRLWKKEEPGAPKRWPAPPEPPVSPAGNALSPPVPKREKKEERNVPASLWDELSPPGDNSRAGTSSGVPASRGPRWDTGPSEAHAGSADAPEPSPEGLAARVVEVVSAFVGSLPPDLAEALRRWVCDAGIAAVWRTLEPSLREPHTAREALERLLRERSPEDRKDSDPAHRSDAAGEDA